ncbi:MAG: hypothetical protein PVI90_10150 [Desulfobacteraceae bacterium]|jgi:hypothetical protein
MSPLSSYKSSSDGQKEKRQNFKNITDSALLMCTQATLLAFNNSLQFNYDIATAMNVERTDFGDQIQAMEEQINSLANPSVTQNEKIFIIQRVLDEIKSIMTQFK